jgi:uncharacterized protein Smg (DUF494 family)
MTAKIVEILAKILEGLSNNASMEEVNRSLLKNHQYDSQTLGIAFSLIYDKVITRRTKGRRNKKEINQRFRILTEPEKELLGIDNCNYLLHLINVGLLDYVNLEAILDQIFIFPESKITRKEINWIILLSLVELDSEILPGSRVLLYTSDTVN